MVVKFRVISPLILIYTLANGRLGGKRFCMYQKKHLSKMVEPSHTKQLHLKEKFYKLIDWYDEFTGMDEVRMAQRRVLEDEKKFREAQEQRRLVLKELSEIQAKLKDLYGELDSTNRSDDRYVTLVTEEHKLLKEEKVISEKFAVAEKLEREHFAALSSSVKLSHEKERAQGERTKYWSIIGSVMGTIIGILGSSINNHFKMAELKELIRTSSDKQLMENFKIYVETNERLLQQFQENEKTCQSYKNIEKLLNNLNIKVNDLEKDFKTASQSPNRHSSTTVFTSEAAAEIEIVEKTVKKEIMQTKIILFSLVVLSILMPVITRYT